MCQNCEWEELLEDVDEMMDNEKYEFASDTLEGIRDWVAEKEHCTESQQNAVENIQAVVE